MKPTAKIMLDTRRALKTGKFPIKIRIGFVVPGKQKLVYHYYPTDKEMFESEFDKLYSSRVLQPTLIELTEQLNKATTILGRKPYTSKQDFDYQFTSKGNFESVQGLFDTLKSQCNENQVVTMDLLKTVKDNLTKFKGTLVLAEITPDFLHKWEEWNLEREVSYTTIGIYSRYIRQVWNYAIREGLISSVLYPFGRGKFIPPSTAGRKITLSETQKNALISSSFDNPDMQLAVDFWTLSYLLSGLNIKDILLLKNKNISTHLDAKVITIHRAKTSGRKRVMREMIIPVTDKANAIILKYGSKSLNPDAYIFNILEDGLSPIEIDARKDSFVKKINKNLSLVRDELSEDSKLNIPKLTTYVARHTFAHIMKLKDIPVWLRQEMMNHEDSATTERYGRGNEIAEKLKAASLL